MKKVIIVLGLLLGCSLFVFSDQPNPTNTEPKYYENAKVIRVKYTSGEAFVQRSYDEGFEQATVNLPVFEKDKAGTTSGRMEFYLGRSNYLRLDFDTEVIFSEIPALRTTNAGLRILKGGVYLDIDSLDAEKDMEIQTPDCGIFLLDRGIFRINVNEAGYTEIYVFEGTAEVAGDNTSRIVRANQKTIMASGDFRERPFYFQTSDRDGFDEWNEQRNRAIGYARHSASRYLESGYEDYEYELSHSGRWVYEPSYSSYIWMPYNIANAWRPYWHGRWIWHPFYGYVWNSYDSWGWFTHYYGRWQWNYHYGWYWLPGYHWSPAWVSWFWNDYYYGWCPLSYWNRPLIVLNKKWLKNYNYRKGIPIHSQSNIIIRKNQLSSSHIDRVALKRGSLSHVSSRTLTYRGSAPRNQLKHSRVNLTDARGRELGFKKGGILSSEQNRSSRSVSSKSQQRLFKYSSKRNSSEKPFKSYRSQTKPRSSYQRKSTSKSYRSHRSSASRSGKSTSRSARTSKSRSSSNKNGRKRKTSQPYFSSRYTRTSPSGKTTSPYHSSRQKSYSSRSSQGLSTKYYTSRSKSDYSRTRTQNLPRYRSSHSSTGNYPRYQSRSATRSTASGIYRSRPQSSYRTTSRSSSRYPSSSRSYRSSHSSRSSSSRSYTRSRTSVSRSHSRSRSSSSSSKSSSSRSSSSSGRKKH